jgi:hypothetical protein
MFAKALIAVTAALVVTTSLASIAAAQRAARPEVRTVQPFTEEERNWFLIPEAPERFPNLPK